MNKRLKKLLETTLPKIISFGLIETVVTHYIGWEMGILGVMVFAIVDLIFI